jgi:hypothetical protein
MSAELKSSTYVALVDAAARAGHGGPRLEFRQTSRGLAGLAPLGANAVRSAATHHEHLGPRVVSEKEKEKLRGR